MKTKLLLLSVLFTLATPLTHAQGTLVYDQQSSTDEASPFGSVPIQVFGTVGQSFTPSLSTVGFVRLRLFDITPGNALGATVAVNLRANAINGTILGATSPVTMTNGFAGSMSFFFASAVPVTPLATYFFETVVQSGDNWGITTLGDTYANGVIYGGLQPFSGNDLWFREGIVVPEPSAMALLASGVLAGLLTRGRAARKRDCVDQ